MTWTQQRQLVKSLSDQAQHKKRDAARIQSNLNEWMKSYLGSVETLVWLFAAGSFWAAGRSSVAASGATGRSMVSVINTSLLAWQLANRQIELAPPIAGDTSEEKP